MVIAFLRTIILYIFIIAGIRLMGKRQVGELEPSELVLALLIADLAAVPMQDFGIPLLTGLIPILTLLCITMALSVLTMKSVKFRAVLCGRPSIIVENGKLRQGEMKRNRFTLDELMEELRKYAADDIYVIGGESIYRMLLPECDTVLVTKIDRAFQADTYFPNLDEMDEWEMTEEGEEQTCFDLEFRFTKYERK